MASRARTILINSLSTYARMFLGLFIGLAITRVALRVIADDPEAAKEAFGVFVLATSLIGFGTFFNESLQNAMVRHLAAGFTPGDDEQAARWFSSAWCVYAVFGLAVAALTAVVGPWVILFFDVPDSLLPDTRGMIYVLAAIQVVNALGLPWIAALRAQDRFTLDNVRGLLTQLLVLAGLLALPYAPVSPMLALAAAWSAPNALTQAAIAAWVAFRQPSLRVRPGCVHRPYCKAMIHFGGWNGVIAFTSRLYEHTDQVLINLLIGPAYNTFYAVALQFQGYLTRIIMAFASVLLPTMTRIAVRGASQEARQMVTHATRYIMTLALPAVICVVIYRGHIIHAWLGAGFEPAIHILPLVMFLMLMRCPNQIAGSYLRAADRIKWPAIVMLVDGVANVFLSIILVVYLDLGLTGIVLGTVTTNVLSLLLFHAPYAARLLKMPLREYWLAGLTRPVVATLTYAPWLYLAERAGVHLYTHAAIAGLAATAYLFTILCWIFGDYERNTIFNWSSRASTSEAKSD